MNSNKIACPLDCYDSCEAVYVEGKIKPNQEHPTTKSKLCKNFAYLLNEDKLEQAKYENENVGLSDSLNILEKKLKDTDPLKVLYYKGSGNLGVMQNSPKIFFNSYGATLTRGSLCDGAGNEGLRLGRGKVVNPPLEKLLNADVIICWGRNFSVTSAHMYELVKDKTFITIDPIKTDIASKSEIHLQINPKTDHELALLLTRFAYMDDLDDEKSYGEYANGADWFFDLAKSRPLVSYEQTIGISLSQVTKMMQLLENKSVAILLGLGVQKYYEGAQITRAIDSFATYIGLHNKDAGGLWYLSDSEHGYKDEFEIKAKKRVDLPSVNFSDFDLVFIQGANPVVSSPNTSRVIEGLKNTFVVYFGTTLNDTCEYANLIIPSSNFLAKRDLRLSYGHEYKAISNKVEEKNENTISEYEFTNVMNKKFGFDYLKDEIKILENYMNTSPEYSSIEKFNFIEDLEIDVLYEDKDEDEYYFITAKQPDCLNSQFKVDNNAYLNSLSNFNEDDEVIISSSNGSAKFNVKLCENVKKDCVLIYAGAKNANYVTTHKSDEESFSAMLQEVLVNIELS